LSKEASCRVQVVEPVFISQNTIAGLSLKAILVVGQRTAMIVQVQVTLPQVRLGSFGKKNTASL
jgi:hypothetical protein